MINPFNDGDPQPTSNDGPKIRTDRTKAGTSIFSLRVTDISEPQEGDYGPFVIATGTLEFVQDCVGGTVDEPEDSPSVGEKVTYLISTYDPDHDEVKHRKPKHIEEEIAKAVKRATGRPGALRVGDLLSVKLAELKPTNAAGKKYPKGKEFGRHVVKIDRDAAPQFDEDRPF